jgi:hypothetical protein
MKTIRFFTLLALITVSFTQPAVWADEWETYDILQRLLSITRPETPLIYEDFAIFTADSSLRRVGIAFAHENFANTYWFKKLVVYNDHLYAPIPPGQKFPDPYKDSGIQFYIYKVPQQLKELEYRLVINGLWTTDPNNSQIKRDAVSGLTLSVLRLPLRPSKPDPFDKFPEAVTFTFKGPPGENVTVAGTFNGWDPFMYELKESPSGIYTLALPLTSGTYQYVFFCRGQRIVDAYNPNRSYARDGKAASVIEVP